MTRYEVFPVPRGMTDDEAFAELSIMGEFREYRWWRLRFRWPLVKWAVWRIDD